MIGWYRLRFAASWACAVLLVGGCASVPEAPVGAAADRTVRDCLVFFDELDRLARVNAARDGGEYRIPGFPYLRTDRFTASFGTDLAPDQSNRARYSAWVDRMRSIDAEARRYETSTLEQSEFPVLRQFDLAATLAVIDRCGAVLVEDDATKPERRRQLIDAAVVPDDYSVMRRVLGLYSITGIGFAASVRNWQEHARETFEAQRRATYAGRIAFQRYPAPDAPASASAAHALARSIMAASPLDPLGIPQIPADRLELLFTAYAPSFEIATAADSDRFGLLRWIDLKGLMRPGSDPFWLDVDTSQPAVYRRLEFTRFGSSVLPQLVYTIWFSERPRLEAGDLYGGQLDGLTWRVTLDEDGEPLIYDSIAPSGRFGMFFPTRRLSARPASDEEPLGEWAFSPIDEPIGAWVGAAQVAGLSLYVSSQNHQLVGLGKPGAGWGEPIGVNEPYRLLEADALRALSLPGGGQRSLYDAGGQVPGSERLGRLIFWPMGIANAGAMRQPGRQPTALIGRRHFDDARLIEERFQRVR